MRHPPSSRRSTRRCPVPTKHSTKKEFIEIRDPDDEIVGHGDFHVERMSKHNIWIGFYDENMNPVHLDLYSKTKIKMLVRDER